MTARIFGLALVLTVAAAAFAEDRGERIATVALVSGLVKIVSGEETRSAEPGTPLYRGDVIQTYDPGKAQLVFVDDTVLNLGHETKLQVGLYDVSLDRRNALLEALEGRFKVTVGPFLTGPSDFEVHTPSVAIGVKGTTFWGDIERDTICALAGRIRVTLKATPNDGPGETALADGACATGFRSGEPSAVAPTPEELRRYLEEVTPEAS